MRDSVTGLKIRLSNERYCGDTIFDALKQQQKLNNLHFDSNKSLLQNDILGSFLLPLCSGINGERLRNGQKVFQTYPTEVMTILGLYSLPYCYAAAKGAGVLVLSKYLLENPDKRLMETGEFICKVNAPEAFEERGDGVISILKVRLMHASVRLMAMKTIKNEIPINQEDLLGTLLSFSLIVVRGLRLMGIKLPETQTEDYLYMWNIIGQIMGVKEDLIPTNIRECTLIERCIRERQFKKSGDGMKLVNSLVKSISQNWPVKAVKPESLIAAFVGEEVSKCLGINASYNSRQIAINALKTINFFQSKGAYNANSKMLLKDLQNGFFDGSFGEYMIAS